MIDEDVIDEQLTHQLDDVHRQIAALHARLFALLAGLDVARSWEDVGARDAAHWVSIRYGISWWKADRWIRAAQALRSLPRLARALEEGDLSVDKAVELARFATPENESRLIAWARGVSPGAVRRKADLACRRALQDERDAHRTRFLWWWTFDDGKRFGLEGELPAAEGAIVARALERLADVIPLMPDEDAELDRPARRADALVALAGASIAADADPERATVVVHAPLQALVDGEGGCEVEGGVSIHAETARRLLCNGRLQVIAEDEAGDPVGVGRLTRQPTAWMMRQLRHRDGECRFPGCGTRAFTHAHHIVWWERGGRTDLDNLVLLCSFHHRLVHEYGWTLARQRDGTVEWFRPDGAGYLAGPREGLAAVASV